MPGKPRVEYEDASMYYVSRLVCEENKRPKGRRSLWRQLKSAKR